MSVATAGTSSIAPNASELIADMRGDRRNWRWMMVPQFIFVLVIAVAVAGITVAGLYSSVGALWSGADIATFEKTAKIVVTASSSLLGFILIKLLNALRDIGFRILEEERFFTKHINMAKLAQTQPDLLEMVKEYHRVD